MATITGTAKGPDGVALTSGTITFERNPASVVASGDDTIFPAVTTATIGAAGAMSFSLHAGTYTAVYNGKTSFPFYVPSGAAADFNDCLDPPVAP